MRESLAALILGCLLGLNGLAAVERDDNPGTSLEDQVLQVLSEGVNLYYTGRYEEAAATLRNGLDMLPPDQHRILYDFFNAIGHVKYMRMAEQAELEPVMREVLRRHRIYQQDLRRDPGYIAFLIDKLDQGTEDQKLVATKELAAIGPVAVPLLVTRLVDSRKDRLRTQVRVTLTEMGPRAVIPLCEALKAADERLVQSAAVSLADIRDVRALPHLQRLVDDPDLSEVTKRVAANSLAEIASAGQLEVLPDGPLLFFQEALRYLRDGDHARDEVLANEALMWHWDEELEGGPGLIYQTVPRYAWNELIAEQLLFDGARAYPEHTPFYPLLAVVLDAQIVEVELQQRLAESRVSAPSHPDQTIDALADRALAQTELVDRVLAFGPIHLYRAVELAIVNERYDVAVHLLRLFQDPRLAQADSLLPDKEEGLTSGKPGTVLVAALEHPEKRVRYQAAVTLAHLDPTLEFFAAELVVPLLAEAVGEWGMKVVLVVEPDYRERNAARKALWDQGFLVFTANDGFEARSLLAKTPVKDAIILAGDLEPSLRDEFGRVIEVPEQNASGMIDVLRADPSTEKTPIFLSLPENEELAVSIQNAIGQKATGVVRKPFNGVAMAGAIDAALGDDRLGDVNRDEREDIALRAALALGAVDPVRSQFALAGAVDSLVASLVNRSDAIRIAALAALANSGARDRIDAVTEVYRQQDETLTPEVRIAFLECIGAFGPDTDAAVEILKAAVAYDTGAADANLLALERAVRAAAHRAIGHAPTIDPRLLLEYQLQQRLDVRAPGAAAPE